MYAVSQSVRRLVMRVVGLLSLCSLLPRRSGLVCLPVSDTGFGTIFTSDDRGIVYSKSLDRHLYTTTGGETDFTNVTSLRGVYITSVLSEGESGHSCASAASVGS